MNANKLRLTIGCSLEENRLKEPDLDDTKAKFDRLVRDAAKGKAVDELNGVEIAALAKADRKQVGADRLNPETARLLDLGAKATYSEAILYCRAALIRELVPA